MAGDEVNMLTLALVYTCNMQPTWYILGRQCSMSSRASLVFAAAISY